MSFRSILSHFWSNILLTFKLVFFFFFNNLRQTKPTQPWTQHRGKTLQTAAAPCGTLSIFKHKKSYQTKQTKKTPSFWICVQTDRIQERAYQSGRSSLPTGGGTSTQTRPPCRCRFHLQHMGWMHTRPNLTKHKCVSSRLPSQPSVLM